MLHLCPLVGLSELLVVHRTHDTPCPALVGALRPRSVPDQGIGFVPELLVVSLEFRSGPPLSSCHGPMSKQTPGIVYLFLANLSPAPVSFLPEPIKMYETYSKIASTELAFG